VAACAYGGDYQALTEQPFAVDTLRIALEDMLLGDVVYAIDRRALGVALGAHLRNIQRCDGRIGIAQREDIVVAVTVLAHGRQFVALVQPLSVDALEISGDGLLVVVVTAHTIDAFQALRVGILLYAVEFDVAVDAV
jgi:hypothetical protein